MLEPRYNLRPNPKDSYDQSPLKLVPSASC
jgi:hypothetical protein